MIKYLFFAFISLSCVASGQTKKTKEINLKKTYKRFEINRYQISPEEQLVYGQQMTGGTDYLPNGSQIHWDGYEYVPVKEIDFKTTSLIFMGNMIAFKEFFPIKTVDISSLKVIHYSMGYDDNYTTILSPLENKVYLIRDNRIIYETDVLYTTHVRQLIFKDVHGQLYFIPFKSNGLRKINIPVDEASLQHVVDNYYTDKNGLYFFDEYTKNTQQLESSNGKNIHAILHPQYFVYGNAAYPYGRADNPRNLRLNSNKLNFLATSYAQYIGDENKLFVLSSGSSSYIGASINPHDFIQKGTPTEPFNEWKWIDIITVGGNKNGNTLYFSSKNHYAGSGSYYSLIQTPKGFYGITGSSMELKAVKFDKVMIYNQDTKEYESIEIDKFRRLTTNFYIYKNRMYYSDSYPVETTLNLEKLYPITLHGKATEFYTDGTYLLGGYNLDNKLTESKGTETWYKFSEPLFQDVDWETLHIVDEKTMLDKNNIYQEDGSMLKITPIKELGIPVKVVEVLP